MQKLFGTDGIRGEANVYPMTPEIALATGKAVAEQLRQKNQTRQTAVIGGDTRRSRILYESALTAGFIAGGMDVQLVGTLPTPGIAELTRQTGAAIGVAITASHNPASDNGIKIFTAGGIKLDDAQEDAIAEKILSRATEKTGAPWQDTGLATKLDDAVARYTTHLQSTVDAKLFDGLNIVLDAANGAGFEAGPLLFRSLGAQVDTIGVSPDGLNINDACGAMHPEAMLQRVRETGAQFGVALDGDADRVVLCDRAGVTNGDQLIAALALSLDRAGRLAHRTVVVTSMTNLGLHAALTPHGIRVATTDVGDRYVIERMRADGFNFGGENSGHLIFGEFAPTGDALLAALQTIAFVRASGCATLAEWIATAGMTLFPQQLVGLRVREKIPLANLPLLRAATEDATRELGADGRVVVRYSGTENKIRLLVEARAQAQVDRWMDALKDAVQKELN